MSDICEHCGAKTVEYRHPLAKHMVESLAILEAYGGGPINLKELGLNRNQWDNFQKLRYFDPVEQVVVDGQRQRGVWAITPRGGNFLLGFVTCPPVVWTYRGERVRYEGPPITSAQALAGYRLRRDWADDARPHEVGPGDGE